MNAEMIQNAIGDIQDEYIQDAETRADRKLLTWTKWLPLAACLIVAVLVAVPLLNGNGPAPKDAPTNGEAIEMVDVETTSIDTTSKGAEPTTEMEPAGTSAGAFGVSSNGDSVYAFMNDDNKTDYEAVITNPVFATLFASDAAEGYELVEISAQDEAQFVVFSVDGSSPVHINHDGVYRDSDFQGFADAEDNGALTTNNVDGIEIQTYNQLDYERAKDGIASTDPADNIYWERLSVDGDWYLLYGADEAAVDAIATELAHIAAQL